MGGPGGFGPEPHPCHPAVNPAMDPNHQMHPQDPNYYNSLMGAGQPGQGTQYPPHASAPPGQYPNYPSEMHHMNNMNPVNAWNWGSVTSPGDSGIHSRDQSGPPSVISEPQHSNISGYSIDNSTSIDWTRYQRSNCSRSEDDIRSIKQAIDQAIESIKQAEDVERILPLLRQNLMDDDVRCTYLSAKALQDLIKIDRYLPSLMKHQQFWQAVTAALDKTDNEHIAKELTRIIYTLTSKESNQGRGWCSLICNCDGLRILIKMLDATVEFVVTLSVTSIHNILTKLSTNERDNNPNPKSPILTAFRDKNGVVFVAKKMHERLMTLRNSPTDSKLQSKIQTGAKFITICLAILHTVAYKCQRTKNILLHEQVPDLVVNTIQLVPNNDKLSCYAVRLLKVLSVCQNNKARIVECGGITTLGNLIEINMSQQNTRRSSKSETNIVHALWTLRNLSDEASRQPREFSYHKVMEVLIKLIQRDDIVKRNLSVNILYNLICRNYQNKVLLISQFNGLDIIIQRIDETLRRGLPTKADDKSATTDILESSIATLRILAKENEYVPEQNDIAKQAQHQLRTNQSYFSVISSLYLNNHDFSQSKKILSEILKLLVNILSNRGFEQVHPVYNHFSIQCTIENTHTWRI